MSRLVFSENKNVECCLLQILLGVLRVKITSKCSLLDMSVQNAIKINFKLSDIMTNIHD